jgi:hypothetical protein
LQDAAVSIEVDGGTWVAENPREICRGECTGHIEYIPNHEGSDAWLKEHLGHAAYRSDEKRIYICDSASMSLRPLLPHALGFIFSEGAALGHFARVLRQHRIPACIDPSLWQRARDVVLSTDTSKQGWLRCGRAIILSEGIQARYRTQLEGYRQRLNSNHLVIPVYDVADRSVWAKGAVIDTQISEKALAVNALQVEGFPVAKALILTNLAEGGTRLDDDSSFVSLVEQSFPLFGYVPGYTLIVRGSLYSGNGSHSACAGLLTSPSVTSLNDMTRTIEVQVSRWKGARECNNQLGLSIIIQERVATLVRGILGTGRPWDYNTEGVVTELTLNHRDDSAKDQVFLGDVEADLQNGSVRKMAKLFSKKNPMLNEDRFCETFGQLVHDGLVLRDRYSVPLDIEFVITGDSQYVFVQFRPLFHI